MQIFKFPPKKKISVTTQIRQNLVPKSSKKNKCDLTLIREVRVTKKRWKTQLYLFKIVLYQLRCKNSVQFTDIKEGIE